MHYIFLISGKICEYLLTKKYKCRFAELATLKLPYACKLLFQVKSLIPTVFRLVLPLKLNSPLNITTLSCNSLVTGTAVDECCSASCSKGNVDKL